MLLPFIEHGSGPTVAFMHGFTQTKRSWSPLINELGGAFHTISFDAPGHGDAAMLAFTCSEAATAVNNVAGTASYVGYSMGARIMLHAALQFPDEVQRLVLISGSPGLRTATERADRVAADLRLANRCKQIGVENFVDEWLRGPLFSGLDADNNQRADRLTNTAEGLAHSLVRCGTGAQDSLWESLSSLSMPVLLIVGEHDAKFRLINESMVDAIGSNAQLVAVPAVGHSAHLEAPSTVAQILTDFLS